MTRPHATMIVGTALISLIRGGKSSEKNDGHTPSGWSKELKDDISTHVKVISQSENMMLRLTTGLPRDCMGPERTLVMLQKCKEGKPHEEDSGSSVILEPNEVQVSRHARNFSIA